MGIVNNFRTLGKIKKISKSERYNNLKRYDEPTYLSFKLKFGEPSNSLYNRVSSNTSYDFMPHPLFQRQGVDDDYLYSAIDYLYNINEPVRAKMLEEFLDLFDAIQNDYQWYFQSITGLDTLLTIDPTKGIRVTRDNAKITINCIDALDRRIFYMMNLYRKIAWDDTYQRWILPDMMRFFSLDIYVTEFRNFHVPFNVDSNSIVAPLVDSQPESANPKNLLKSVVSDVVNVGKRFLQDTFRTFDYNDYFAPVALKLMDDILPTHIIHCEMCEFDITSFKSEQYASLSVSDEPSASNFQFSVIVGKVHEDTHFPLFGKSIIDNYINGLLRVDEERYGALINSRYTSDLRKLETMYGNDTINIPENKKMHVSGDYYHEQKIRIDDPLHTSNTEAWIKRNMYMNNSNILKRLVNNTTSFGVGVAKNIISDTVNRLKMHEIKPGVSFNSVQSMIASGDLIASLGMLRRALENTYESNGIPAPREELDKSTDDAFKAFLAEYSKATVSMEETPLQDAAKKALMDSAYYGRIKDASKATDMIGPGEINTYGTSLNNDDYDMNHNINNSKDNRIVDQTGVMETIRDFSKATDMVGNGENNIFDTSIKNDGYTNSSNINSGLSNQVDNSTGTLQILRDFSKATNMVAKNEENIFPTDIQIDGLYKEIKATPTSSATNGFIIMEGMPSSK